MDTLAQTPTVSQEFIPFSPGECLVDVNIDLHTLMKTVQYAVDTHCYNYSAFLERLWIDCPPEQAQERFFQTFEAYQNGESLWGREDMLDALLMGVVNR